MAVTTGEVKAVQSVSEQPDTPSMIPTCDGLKVLQPFNFRWPDYEKRMRQLKGSEFGYYHCGASPELTAAFLREHMKTAPFRLGEVSWAERPEGSLAVFYDYAGRVWTYLWILPDPSGRGARVVAARSKGEAFRCRLETPDDQKVPGELGVLFSAQGEKAIDLPG
jgi:hypothetical protein